MSNQFDFQKCRQDQDISPQGQHNSGLLFSNQVDYIPLAIDRIDPPHLWPAIRATLFHFLPFGNVCSSLKTADKYLQTISNNMFVNFCAISYYIYVCYM